MRDVAVIGVGIKPWGEIWEKSLRTLFVEAAAAALDDAGTDRIDSMYIGNMSGGLFVGQEHLGALMADYLGVAPVPGTRVESACASGGLAFRQAYIDVASGASDYVLAAGVEKMTDVDGGEATYALAAASDREYEAFHGITFPGLYAMIARAYMHRHGATREQLAQVAVKNHENGALNPNAQYPQKVTLKQVMTSTMVADPIRVLDCSPITDGAAAILLCPLDEAKRIKKAKARVAGSGHATDTIALSQRKELTWFAAAEKSAETAYKQAGKSAGDMSLAEVHDCFTIAEIVVSESLGFFERGQGAKAAEAGETARSGRIPINPSGGLKSKGHPIGATGIAQIVEVTEQLCGNAGKRQIKNAKLGLTQNMGGTCASSVVHILEAV